MKQEITSSAARTDDLLASGADSKDGAQGFGNKSTAGTLKTGMEGIPNATSGQGNKQSDSQEANQQNQTLTDNPGQLQNKQAS